MRMEMEEGERIREERREMKLRERRKKRGIVVCIKSNEFTT